MSFVPVIRLSGITSAHGGIAPTGAPAVALPESLQSIEASLGPLLFPLPQGSHQGILGPVDMFP